MLTFNVNQPAVTWCCASWVWNCKQKGPYVGQASSRIATLQITASAALPGKNFFFNLN